MTTTEPKPKPLQMKVQYPQEWEEQAALFNMKLLYEKKHPILKLMFHIPNGSRASGFPDSKSGKRICLEGARLKAMGVQPGVPDIFVSVPRAYQIAPFITRPNSSLYSVKFWSYHGFYIEMKAHGQKPMKEQLAYHELLREQGYKVEWFDAWYNAWNAIVEYLGLPEDLKQR